MNLLQKWAALVDQAADYILVSIIVAAAGALVSKAWREDPKLPLAATLLGPVAGLFGLTLLGSGWAILLTFIGTGAGPALVLAFQDPATVRRFVEHALERIAPKKDGE